MHKTTDITTRRREFEFTAEEVEQMVADEVRAKNNLPATAEVKVEIDVGSSGIFRGATATVTESVNS